MKKNERHLIQPDLTLEFFNSSTLQGCMENKTFGVRKLDVEGGSPDGIYILVCATMINGQIDLEIEEIPEAQVCEILNDINHINRLKTAKLNDINHINRLKTTKLN